MKADQPGAAGRRSLMRSLLVGGQAAASIVILLAAALLLRGLYRAATLDVGVDLDRFFTISVGLSGGYDRPRAEAYWVAALERMRQVQDVAAVTLASSSPFDGRVGPQQWTSGRVGLRATVGDDYFIALRLQMLRGRTFTREEVRLAAPVAVISELVAREFWGDADPVGDTLERVWGVPARPDPLRPAGVRVVGVVAEVLTSLEMFDAPTIYRPLAGSIHNWQVVVRTVGDPATTVAPVLAALKSIDPEQRPDVYFPRDGWRRQLVWPSRLATLSSILGIAGLALALIGLVGVTAFTAGQRRHEASVRTALGARTGDVVRLFCRDSLRPVALGLGIGVVASFWTSRLLAGMLYGVGVHDPVAFVGAILTLLIGATAAALIPAFRAARVDPAQLLRSL